jgi:hypothetical protein
MSVRLHGKFRYVNAGVCIALWYTPITYFFLPASASMALACSIQYIELFAEVLVHSGYETDFPCVPVLFDANGPYVLMVLSLHFDTYHILVNQPE